VLREEAWIEVDLEPAEEGLMGDDEFERQAQMAAEGRWEELGLDPLPADWTPATIEDLRNAA
jgi:hypothetical protein